MGGEPSAPDNQIKPICQAMNFSLIGNWLFWDLHGLPKEDGVIAKLIDCFEIQTAVQCHLLMMKSYKIVVEIKVRVSGKIESSFKTEFQGCHSFLR